jgi:hypothetical protein
VLAQKRQFWVVVQFEFQSLSGRSTMTEKRLGCRGRNNYAMLVKIYGRIE